MIDEKKEEEKVEKTSITKEEIEVLASQKAGDMKEKIAAIITEQKDILPAKLFEEFKAKLPETLGIIQPSAEEDEAQKEADKKAKEFDTFGEFLTSIRNARSGKALDKRLTYVDAKGNLKTAGHMEEGDDTQGGFLVPEMYRNDIQMIQLESSIVRANGATIFPAMKTDSLKIPTVVDTSHVTTVHGGVQVLWTAEAAQKTPTKPAFGQMELVPHKLVGLIYASDELMADSAVGLVPLIKRMFGGASGFFEDDAFINGTGAGQPLGILNCNALIAVLRNTANRVMLEDLAEMYQRMLPPSHASAVWVINPSVIAELLELGTGNAADASGKNLIWIDTSQGAAKTPPFKIFGRPVLISEKMQALGTQGDILYADMKYYFIFDRQPITIDASTHLRFDYDETVWRFVLRVAGQCWPGAAQTWRRGGLSWSPFVVLDADTS